MKTITLREKDLNAIRELVIAQARSYERDYRRTIDFGNDMYAEVLLNEANYYRELACQL